MTRALDCRGRPRPPYLAALSINVLCSNCASLVVPNRPPNPLALLQPLSPSVPSRPCLTPASAQHFD